MLATDIFSFSRYVFYLSKKKKKIPIFKSHLFCSLPMFYLFTTLSQVLMAPWYEKHFGQKADN